MPLINYEPTPRPKSHKSLTFILGIGALAGMIALGSTLAANINLNTGGAVEFGQGIAATTACDSNIVITPFPSFTNAEGGGSFKVETIRVSDIDMAACSGKDFIIKAYRTTPSALNFIGNISTITVIDDGSTFKIPTLEGVLLNSSDSSSFSLVIDSADPTTLSASDVYRFTIESQVHVEPYPIGSTGPGGGTVFYHSPDGFNCGPDDLSRCHYLEVASNTWFGGTSDPGLPWFPGGSSMDILTLENIDWGGSYAGNAIALLNNVAHPSTALGAGYLNTVKIISPYGSCLLADCDYAAGAANAFHGNGLTDWYLPNATELGALCQWSRGQTPVLTSQCGNGAPMIQGGLLADNYWTSNEKEWSTAHYEYFQPSSGADGVLGYTDKANPLHVRPIRAF